MAEMQHYCSACGEVHGGSSRESEEVKIAKINADRDIEVAKLSRAEMREMNEAHTEQTEIEAGAAVEQTAIEAEAITEIGVPPEAEPAVPVVEAPVVVEAPQESVDEPPAPPETEPAPSHSRGGGMWAGYH